MDDNKLAEYFSSIIIEKLNDVASHSVQPWVDTGIKPKNIDGRCYQGYWNIFFLALITEVKKFKFPFFLTTHQAKSLQLDFKGAKCIPVLFFSHYVKPKAPEHPKINYEIYSLLPPQQKLLYNCYPVLRYNMVMNIDMTNYAIKYPEELEKLSYKPFEHQTDTNEILDKVLKEQSWFCRINEKIGGEAFYQPDSKGKNRDYIELPHRSQFPNIQDFYSTALHEMTHSTGAASRLNRESITHYPRTLNQVALEELIAELGAVFSGLYFNINRTIDKSNLIYIKNWLQGLHNDTSYITDAVKAALQATNMIVEKVQSLSKQIQKDTTVSTTELIYQNLTQELSINSDQFPPKSLTNKIH